MFFKNMNMFLKKMNMFWKGFRLHRMVWWTMTAKIRFILRVMYGNLLTLHNK